MDDDGPSPITPRHGKLGEVLSALRRKAGITQASLSRMLKRPQPYVSKYEQGRLRIDAVELIEVADLIGCSLDAVAAAVRKVNQEPEVAADLRRRPPLPVAKRRAREEAGDPVPGDE